MSDLAPLFLGALLVGVVWRMRMGFAAVLVAARARAGPRPISIARHGVRRHRPGVSVGLGLLVIADVGAILLLPVHSWSSRPVSLAVLPAVPPGCLASFGFPPGLAHPLTFFFLFSSCLLSGSQFQLLGYSMRPRPIGSVRYAVGVEIVAHLSRECGSLQLSSRMIRPQASRRSRPRPQRRRSPFGTRPRRGKIAGRGRCAGSGARDGSCASERGRIAGGGADCAPRLCDTNCALAMLW